MIRMPLNLNENRETFFSSSALLSKRIHVPLSGRELDFNSIVDLADTEVEVIAFCAALRDEFGKFIFKESI